MCAWCLRVQTGVDCAVVDAVAVALEVGPTSTAPASAPADPFAAAISASAVPAPQPSLSQVHGVSCESGCCVCDGVCNSARAHVLAVLWLRSLLYNPISSGLRLLRFLRLLQRQPRRHHHRCVFVPSITDGVLVAAVLYSFVCIPAPRVNDV